MRTAVENEVTAPHPGRRVAAVLAAGAAAVLGLSGCMFFGSEPDVTPEGQAAYACSLAESAIEGSGDVTDWDAPVGENADNAASQALAAGSLVGGSAGYALPDHPELSEAGREIFSAFHRFDLEALADSLEDMVAACDGVDASGSQDVSVDGQAEYGCALADYVVDEHGPSDTWGSLGEEPAFHLVSSVGALFGGLNASALPGSGEQREGASAVIEGLQRFDTEAIDDGLQDVVENCRS